ncbi:MAG: flippase-like domain-containing protein [Acidobacteria bacterium]|nr:flippase-like domain-containing protein [Acidobacteriota bacterium]
MKKKALPFIKIAITVLLFAYIFQNVDFENFGRTLRNARPDMLILSFALIWAGHYVCILRWRLLIKPLMPVPSLNQLFGIYCIGLFFNLTFPTVIGGDVVKIYYIGRNSESYSQSFASTFLDRDAGMLAMLIIACAAIVVYPVSVPGIAISVIVFGAFAAFLLGNMCLFTPRFHGILNRCMKRLGAARMGRKADRVAEAFHRIGKHRFVLAVSLLISFVNQLLVIISVWVTAVGLRLDIPFYYFLVFVPVITLISMIPASLNGMGLREYAFMGLFGALGAEPSSCIALGLVTSILIILSSLPGGIVYIFYRNRGDRRRFERLETEFS